MKVLLCNQITGDTFYLHFEPETDRDRRTLESLVEFSLTCGFGRNPDTNQIMHAQVEVTNNDTGTT